MERYREIIDDWEAFREACQKPKITAVRQNRIKASKDFEERLRREFKTVEQSSWNENVYRLPETEKPGNSTLHWLGDYYVQEESAAIPVQILDPQPGEKILDMCAAPGGKATQIASAIENPGTVIANDSSGKRLKSLHANVYRTGAASISVTSYDGRQLPEREKFDRILVDAPCSGEGDRCRRNFKSASREDIEGLAELQKKLVEKASRLLKDGGTMVYSTCTIAPEENEEVVQHVLEASDLSLEKLDPDLPHREGVTEFDGKSYLKEVSKAVRIYPHHLNSGVMFVARFS